MQTFLPYPDFFLSAQCLDRQRLGKQRVECLQILNVLCRKTIGWRNHPAVKMWEGYPVALKNYGLAICNEWWGRGYDDTVADKIKEMIPDTVEVLPPWFGNAQLHMSHQSNLLRKMPTHYGQFHWNVPNDLPYFWPLE